jgi:hypothetical protein
LHPSKPGDRLPSRLLPFFLAFLALRKGRTPHLLQS